jgi:hypothetical protein
LGRDVEMTGPIKHPSGSIPGLFFLCDRCNFMMKDRRREQRGPGSK